MAKNKTLKAAQKAYNKNQQTKGGKKKAKKEDEYKKSVGSSYEKVREKTQTAGKKGEENREKASVKKAVGSVKSSLSSSNATTQKTSSSWGSVTNTSQNKTFTDKKWTPTDIKNKVNPHDASKKDKTGKEKVTDYVSKQKGTATGSLAKAYNTGETRQKQLEKEGEKKVTTTKNASLLYGLDAAMEKAGYMSKQPREAAKFYDKEEKKAQKEGMTYGDKKEFIRKWVSDKSNQEVLNAIDEYKEQKIKDSSYTYTKAPTSTGDFFIRENASKYANTGVKTETNQPVYQTDKDGNIKHDKDGNPKVKKDKDGNVVYQKIDSTQGNNILDYYGGGFKDGRLTNQNASTEVGNQTAGWIHDAPVAAGAMQGLSYSDITRGLGNYSQAAAKDLQNTKESGAFNVGYMAGQAGQFMLGGTAKMTDSLVKGVTKAGLERSALNVGLRKGAADIMFEAPINTLDAIKMSTDTNGNFDKKAFAKYMALNSGLSGGMGGLIGGVGNKLAKNDAKTYIRLTEKLKAGESLSPQEIKAFENVQKKLSTALESNDVAKADVATKAKADTVLSKADTKEYLALTQKKNAGKITQQENVRLSSYENVIKQNYKEAQDKYAKILADAAAGEKTSIKETKEAAEFFERSGDVVKAQEAETILKNTTKQEQFDIIQKSNPKDESLGDHTWVESPDDIKTFEEAITDEEAGFTPDYTKEMAQEAFDKGEITVYSSKPIEDGAFVTPSKMEAQNYAGSGKVYEQTIKTDDVAWIDNLQGQVAKINATPASTHINPNYSAKVTVIKTPYNGDVPTQKAVEREPIELESSSIDTASNEIASTNRDKGLISRFYLDRFGKGRRIEVKDMEFGGDPYKVYIGKKAVKKVINDKNLSAEKLAVFDKIDDVIADAHYVGSGEYVAKEGSNKDTIRYDYFESDIKVGKDDYVVSFDVEVFNTSNNYRTHKIDKIEVTPATKTDLAESSRADVAPVATARKESSSLSGENISQKKTEVKAGEKPYAPEPEVPDTSSLPKGVKQNKTQRADGIKSVTDALTRNSESADVFTKAEQKEIADAFDEISANIYNGNLGDAQQLSKELADKYGKIDEGYKVSNDTLWDEVKGAQDYLRDITIHTPEGSGTLKEIKEKYTGDTDWHNLHIRKSKNGKMQSQGVDEVWDELVSEFPEVFSREITDPMERLERLAEVSSMRKADTESMMRYGEEDIASMREDLWTDIYETAQQNAGKFTEPKPEVKPDVKETPKVEKPKAEKPKEKKLKEPEKTEVQKVRENDFASDNVKTALDDIEKAGVYTAEAEKKAKRFNELDRQIAKETKHIENARKSEKYATEAERAERVAELEDNLQSLKNKQARIAGEIEQMGKMKAVDPDKTAGEQLKELRGDVKVNKELKNTDNLTKTDNWIKDKWLSVRRLWEDSLIDVEKAAKESGDLKLRGQILTAANRVRNSMSEANTWITKHRKSFDNKVGGKSLDEIFDKKLIEDEPKYADFQEYLIMKHVPARHAKGTDIYPEVSPELAEKRVKELEDKYRPKDKDGNPLLDKDGKPVKSEVETWAQDVYDYINDLQKYRVDSGMLSKEAAEQFAKDYPFYVPTNRVNDEAIDFFSGGVSNGIRSAKGGDNDVLDMYSQLYTATNKTIHAAEENQMLNLYFKAKGVTEEQLKDATLEDLEHAVIEAKVNKKTGTANVSFFVDGKPVRLPCNHQLALGLREMDGLEFERLMKAAKVATLYGKPFKALVTDWNLVFGVRNGARDLQQALVNSKDTRYFGSSMGAAAHSIANADAPYRKLYASMGGEQAQLVSYDAVAKQMGIEKQGKVDAIHEKVQEFVDLQAKGKYVNPIHYIEGINGAIEMMPRMCEFIGTLRKEADKMLKQNGSSLKQLRKEIVEECKDLEKAGKIGQSEISAEVENRLAQRVIDMVGKDTIDTAMRNANDITLNFGRSGVLGKALNMGFVPYLNPSIQGLSKLVRLFTEAGQEGGWKALASIGMKLGTFTIAPAVFNELALKDNEDFQNLNTRDKDNNFFIPLSRFGEEWDGKFLKFPKPRENAVLAEPVEYALRYFLNDSEYAYFDMGKLKNEKLWEKIPLTDEGKQSFRTAIDNIGVINPATSNMLSPLWQTFHNKTWYGGSIESAYESSINEETGKPNVPVNERYDVGTSGIAIALGQTSVAKSLNLSPKKIDNILDSYTGMIYDLGISQTTEEAKTRGNWLFRTMASQFVKDSVFSNKLSTKAWDKMDGMNKAEQDAYKSTYMYDTFKYDDAMDVITADKNMTNKEKMDAKRALQIQKNKLNREAINGDPNTSNPLVDIAKYLGANKTLNKFLPSIGGENTDTWADYYKTYKNAKGFGGLTKEQKQTEAQKFLDVYALGVKGQNKQDPTKFHDSPSWGMTGVAAAQLASQGKLKTKDANAIMKACGVYDSQVDVYHNYAEHGGNVSRYAVTERRVGKTLDKVEDWGMDKKSGLWKGTFDKSMGAKGGTIAMSLATDKKVQFKDRAYYIANSSDPQMMDKMNAARGFSQKYGHKTKEISQLAQQADALGDGNTYLKNDEIIMACNEMKGNNEEKSMAYILLGGKPNKNPFGAIGDFSIDGDTGIQMLDDDSGKGGGHGHGRRRRRGGGGGKGSKGTMPKTESGAIKGKVTDVFATSNGSKASNLNDAYRKKVRKLRKQIN